MADKIILQKNVERNCRKAFQSNFNDCMIFNFDLYPKKKQKFRLISRIIFHMAISYIQQYAYQSNDLYDIIFNLSCWNFLDERFLLLLLYSFFPFHWNTHWFYILRTLSKHKKVKWKHTTGLSLNFPPTGYIITATFRLCSPSCRCATKPRKSPLQVHDETKDESKRFGEKWGTEK